MSTPTVPNIKLNNGYEMPQVGFGLWKVDNATCADTVYNAIKAGYRLFDSAAGMYFSRFLFLHLKCFEFASSASERMRLPHCPKV